MNSTNATVSNVHPIEVFIACLINLVEFIAWTINELAGFHAQAASNTAAQPTAAPAKASNSSRKQQTNATLINQAKSPLKEDWADHVTTLTVKQLRTLTGITNSRYKKAQLIEAALSY